MDISGNNNNGECFGNFCPSETGGRFGNAYFFDGTDDYIEVLNKSSLNPTNSITITAWVKQLTNSSRAVILQKGSFDEQYNIVIENNQILSATLKFKDGQTTTVSADISSSGFASFNLNNSYLSLFS